jgi:hypothetical protein
MSNLITPTDIDALTAISKPEKDELGNCINLPLVSKPIFSVRTLTPEMLRYYLHYFPLTGEWFWRNPRLAAQKSGKPANALATTGYICIRIRSELYLAHRLAFLYMNGAWPKHTVDHINVNQTDNRWENLRDVTHAKNCANSPASHKENYGVYYHPDCDKWVSQVGRNYETRYLGISSSKKEAAAKVQQYLLKEQL